MSVSLSLPVCLGAGPCTRYGCLASRQGPSCGASQFPPRSVETLGMTGAALKELKGIKKSHKIYIYNTIIYIIIYITPTSTPNSRLYSRTYRVFVLAKCHRSAMPLWFHLVFESQRRRHARFGFNRRRAPAPAPGLAGAGAGAGITSRGQITTSVLP